MSEPIKVTDADRLLLKVLRDNPPGVDGESLQDIADFRIAAERATVARIVKRLKEIETTAAFGSDNNDRFYRDIGYRVADLIKELERESP